VSCGVINAGKRIYPIQGSSAGIWHTYSRILDRQLLLSPDSKDFLLKTIRAYKDLLGLEVLTFCIMDNHFHLLLRVPHRPEGLDVALEVILARMERAVGEDAMKLVRRDLRFWETSGKLQAIEEWRQRQMKRMYSMPEFMGCVKQRFCLLRRRCGDGFACVSAARAAGSPGGTMRSQGGGARFGRSGMGR
jgi:REP element-mobilizing transposase RayT